MENDKQHIRDLVELCNVYNVAAVVLSPGSRCAPLVTTFAQHSKSKLYTIVDERAAAFFALGIAQQTEQTVALVCTSGSALLNYAPAICEAFYSQIPLLVLSTDRPPHLIDVGDGQTIRQLGVYSNFVKASLQLAIADNNLKENINIIYNALTACQNLPKGPVQLNVPLDEPLYNSVPQNASNNFQISIEENDTTELNLDNDLIEKWKKPDKVLVIVGSHSPSEKLNKILSQLSSAQNTLVLTERTANVSLANSIYNIDRFIDSLSVEERKDFMPDLIITIGGAIVSKKIKVLLRKVDEGCEHWHFGHSPISPNTFFRLTQHFKTGYLSCLSQLAQKANNNSSYQSDMLASDKAHEKRQQLFLKETKWSDLAVISLVFASLPQNAQLQLGNSTPVRYANLFSIKEKKNISVYANRGTSGIDGSISTASGAAMVNTNLTICITGDLSFFYDSNALWNKHLPENLRVIIINNSGGNIFRIIPGPDKTNELEDFFEANHNLNAKHIAKTFDVPYYFCDEFKGLEKCLPLFYESQNGKPAILEIKTPNEQSAQVLKDYFTFIKNTNG